MVTSLHPVSRSLSILDNDVLVPILQHPCISQDAQLVCQLLCTCNTTLDAAISVHLRGAVPIEFKPRTAAAVAAFSEWLQHHGTTAKSIKLSLAVMRDLDRYYPGILSASLERLAQGLASVQGLPCPPAAQAQPVEATEQQSVDADSMVTCSHARKSYGGAAIAPKCCRIARQSLQLLTFQSDTLVSSVLRYLPAHSLTSLVVDTPFLEQDHNNSSSYSCSRLAALTSLRQLSIHGAEADALLPQISSLQQLTALTLGNISMGSIPYLAQLPVTLKCLRFCLDPEEVVPQQQRQDQQMQAEEQQQQQQQQQQEEQEVQQQQQQEQQQAEQQQQQEQQQAEQQQQQEQQQAEQHEQQQQVGMEALAAGEAAGHGIHHQADEANAAAGAIAAAAEHAAQQQPQPIAGGVGQQQPAGAAVEAAVPLQQLAVNMLQTPILHLTALTELGTVGMQPLDFVDEDAFPCNIQVLDVADCTPAKPLFELQHLRTLKLTDNSVTAAELSAIATHCTQLTTVDLGYLRGTEYAAVAAAGWQNLPLRSLAIGGMHGDLGLDVIQHLGRLTGLTWLQLLDIVVIDAYLITGLSDLTHLDLSGTSLTDFGVKALCRLSGLQHLALSHTMASPQSRSITDAGLRHISQHLTNLTYLALTGTQVTPAGIPLLRRLTTLEHLCILGCGITVQDKLSALRIDTDTMSEGISPDEWARIYQRAVGFNDMNPGNMLVDDVDIGGGVDDHSQGEGGNGDDNGGWDSDSEDEPIDYGFEEGWGWGGELLHSSDFSVDIDDPDGEYVTDSEAG